MNVLTKTPVPYFYELKLAGKLLFNRLLTISLHDTSIPHSLCICSLVVHIFSSNSYLWALTFVNWSGFAIFRLHRSIMSCVYNGMPQFTSHSGCFDDSSSSGTTLASQILSSKALHSWVYPQSSLPPSLISVLTSSATEGGLFNEAFI